MRHRFRPSFPSGLVEQAESGGVVLEVARPVVSQTRLNGGAPEADDPGGEHEGESGEHSDGSKPQNGSSRAKKAGSKLNPSATLLVRLGERGGFKPRFTERSDMGPLLFDYPTCTVR